MEPTPPDVVGPMSVREASNEFTRYHPASDEQIERMTSVRAATADLIIAIMGSCPPCADRSAAIRKAREALMTANAAIVLPPISL
jgi:hypothetical protein